MVDTGILREVYTEGVEEKTYQPALDTHKISVGMVIKRIEAQGTEEFLQAPTPEMKAFWGAYLKLKDNPTPLDNIYINEL